MPSKKTKKRGKLRVGRLLLLVAILLALVFGGVYLKYSSDLKAVSKNSEPISFTVSSGSSARTVIKELKSQGIIKDSQSAYIYARLNHYTDIKMGDYELDRSWDVKTILETLNDSTTAIVDAGTVTIIEGDWAKDIATKISEVTNVSAEELLTLWNDETYIRGLMADYPFLTEDLFDPDIRIKLEGYLYPNTYQLYKETTADDVTRKILDSTLSVYNEYKDAIANSEYSINDVFTLASIIQYESGNVADMKAISQVFKNRLDIGMALQSSVTVCYAIDVDKNNDDWRSCEINSDFDSPYNTYKYPGLPPGPIVNPGRDAIDAVLNPDSSHASDFYFMADVCGQGTVHYAASYEEHLANVNKYLSESGCLN